MTINISYLNRECKAYPEFASPSSQAIDIKLYSFPVTSRGAAKKTDSNDHWRQRAASCPVLNDGEDKEVLQNKNNLSLEKFNQITTLAGMIALNADGIEVAIERRVALFFQQAILCYNMTSFTFHLCGADDQIGTSPSITIKCQDGRKIRIKREAAHSSTLPALIAKAKDGSTPNGFIYLKGGSSHAQHNATIGMHECVNGADELIDGRENGLRYVAIKILNRVASDGLDPIAATKEFLNSFKNRINVIKVRLNNLDKRRFVLIKYDEKVNSIITAVNENKKFFDYLLGVNINHDDEKETGIRSVIYKKRFDMIRLQENLESKIGKLIDDAKQLIINKRDRSHLESILLKDFKNSPYRHVFEKMTGKTAAVFDDDYPLKDKVGYKRWAKRIENLQVEYRDLINNLTRSIRINFRSFSCSEFGYRASVMKDLRCRVNNWTQKEFAKKYEQVTQIKVSQSWVSRLEQLSRLNYKENYITPLSQRRVYIGLSEIQNCASTLNVEPGLFLPFVITSES
jgi:hypothetical protein